MYSVGTGRKKRYTEKTVEVLHFISNAYKSGASANEVQDRLSQSYPVNVKKNDKEVPTVQRSVTMLKQCQDEGVSNAIAPLALMAQMAQQQKVMTEILKRVADRDEEIRKVQKDNAMLKKRLARLEAEINKPWWKKIF
jgi:DNA-binding transcriptional MerR regulator